MKPKFRAWDKISKKMFPVMMIDFGQSYVMIEEINGLWCERDFDEIELMRFTGLKDKNGREIYEGDVVRYECCFESYVEEVIYDDKHCNFGTIDKDEKTFSFDALISDFDVDCFEVVGNKYENLELLGE